VRAAWLVLFAALCCAEFLVTWGKEYVGAKVKAAKSC
jgi:hypothetical protein